MRHAVHRYDLPTLNGLERIPENVPLRMSAGRLLNIAGVGFVAFCPKRFANFLRFLAGNKHFHLSAPPFAPMYFLRPRSVAVLVVVVVDLACVQHLSGVSGFRAALALKLGVLGACVVGTPGDEWGSLYTASFVIFQHLLRQRHPATTGLSIGHSSASSGVKWRYSHQPFGSLYKSSSSS